MFDSNSNSLDFVQFTQRCDKAEFISVIVEGNRCFVLPSYWNGLAGLFEHTFCECTFFSFSETTSRCLSPVYSEGKTINTDLISKLLILTLCLLALSMLTNCISFIHFFSTCSRLLLSTIAPPWRFLRLKVNHIQEANLKSRSGTI